MKKLIVLLAIGFVCTFRLAAQTDIDALRYSQILPGGTARSISMGSSFGALGGDFSCLSMNPAGISIYRRSEISFTPSILYIKANSDYLGSTYNDSKYNFNISNIGWVAHSQIQNASPDGWQSWDFGLGYNRLNNFNSNLAFEGVNRKNSLLDLFTQKANANGGVLPSDLGSGNSYPFDASLAYNNFLINPDSANHYTHVLPNAGETQRMTIHSTGSLGEMVFTLGANYANKFYFGATLGVDYLNYNETSNYNESISNDTINKFKSFNLNRTLNTSGTGINLKLGMLYRLNDYVRFGLAVHTPTFFTMHDDYTAYMNSTFESTSYAYPDPQSPITGKFDYNFTNPLRFIASVAGIIGTYGAINFDYEFVDYSAAKLDASTYDFFTANYAIQHKYTQASNFRVGTEWKFKGISFRGGYSYYGTPFSSGNAAPGGADMSITNYTAGIGVKDKGVSLDFGYVYSMSKNYYVPYTLDGQTVEGATNKINTNTFVMTIGYRF